MSRIDEALRALERSGAEPRGATSSPSSGTTAGATLELYPGEELPQDGGLYPGNRVARPEETRQFVVTTAPAPPGDPDGKLIGHGANPIVVEQYRRLAAELHDAQVQRHVRTVMVTSAVPREGKTLTTLNLALTLSESYNRRVLVVDADLRRPSIHTILGLPNTQGLCDALRDPALAVPVVEYSSNLSVLTAGHAGATLLAGLTSERMGQLLDEFERAFDWVLIDTPPVGFLPDAQLLARLIHAVVFVIGARSTPAAVVERAVAALGSECILGTVLNRVEQDQIQDAGYYYGGHEPSVRVR